MTDTTRMKPSDEQIGEWCDHATATVPFPQVARTVVEQALAWQAEQIVAMLEQRARIAASSYNENITGYREGRSDEADEAAQAVRDMTKGEGK
jgi:hypothetical protein